MRWWGDFDVAEDRGLAWAVGPLRLWAWKRPDSWLLAHGTGDSEDGLPLVVAEPLVSFEPPPEWKVRRFALGAHDGPLTLRPALADRPVIARAERPTVVLPGASAPFYVGSMLWAGLSAVGRALAEIPLQLPSDTWFGPSTREGELCYASRTQLKSHKGELHVRPDLAMIPVWVDNGASTPLSMDRLRLPMPHLSLFLGEDGRVWTEAVRMARDGEDDSGQVVSRIVPGPPPEAGRATLLASPRQEPPGGGITHWFGNLFRSELLWTS